MAMPDKKAPAVKAPVTNALLITKFNIVINKLPNNSII